MSRLVITIGVGLLVACSKGDAPASTPASPPAPKADPAPSAAPEAKKETVGSAASPTAATAAVGQPAPDFELPDLAGVQHRLSQYRGRYIVVEWFNPECPFVNYAHDKGPLRTLAKDLAGDDLVWLAVNSGAPGKQGHGPAANKAGVEKFALEHPVLLDPSGEVGRRFGATKTPGMFLVDPKGVLRYAGAVDNAPFGEVDGEAPHRVHLAEALRELRAGQDVSVAETPPYGCTVKYGS